MTPAKRHDPQVCPLSNLCLSGTGRTEPALPIIPPELSACPTWASPSGFQASSTLLRGQRAPLEALGPGTHPCPQKGPWWPGPLWASPPGRFSCWLWGIGCSLPPLPRLVSPCCCSPLGLQAPHSRWPSLAGKQARWGGAGSSRWMLRNSLLGSLPAVTQPSPTAGTAR